MSYYPYCQFNNCDNSRSTRSILFPFVGGLLIGGLTAPFLIKNNPQPYYYPYTQGGYYPYNSYYPYPYSSGYYR